MLTGDLDRHLESGLLDRHVSSSLIHHQADAEAEVLHLEAGAEARDMEAHGVLPRVTGDVDEVIAREVVKQLESQTWKDALTGYLRGLLLERERYDDSPRGAVDWAIAGEELTPACEAALGDIVARLQTSMETIAAEVARLLQRLEVARDAQSAWIKTAGDAVALRNDESNRRQVLSVALAHALLADVLGGEALQLSFAERDAEAVGKDTKWEFAKTLSAKLGGMGDGAVVLLGELVEVLRLVAAPSAPV